MAGLTSRHHNVYPRDLRSPTRLGLNDATIERPDRSA
jgi:hypothetical protein